MFYDIDDDLWMHANIIYIIVCIKTIHLVLVDLILSYSMFLACWFCVFFNCVLQSFTSFQIFHAFGFRVCFLNFVAFRSTFTDWTRMCSALLDKATIGYIVPEYFKWPGFLSPSMGLKFSDVPNGLAAIGKVPGNGWAQIVAFAGYYELFVYKYNGVPGEYGWKAISSADPEVRKRKLSAELANGRLVSRNSTV